jgi:opacity protein-like surface antigen
MRDFNFLAGPQFKYFNSSRATPFVRALFGASRHRQKVTNVLASATDDYTAFAMALGGGLDVRASKHVDIRLFQIEYLPVFGKDRRIVATDGVVYDVKGNRRDDWRISVGMVFK